jgi:hypothetical protein
MKETAERAAEYMYHFMLEELGSDETDAINAASDIYQFLTGEDFDVEGILGLELEEDEVG